MTKRRITPYQHSSNWSWNCPSCGLKWGKRAKRFEIRNLNKMDYSMCIQLLRFAIFRSCCQQAHGHTFAIANQEPTGLWNFVISVSNPCKKPSRITFLMQVFAGLCTGKVTLSFWMLQNTVQSVQEIDGAKCIGVI